MNGSVKTVLLCGALFASLATSNSAFGQWTRNAGTGETYVTTATDKIGIGTSTPQSKVHIYSTENFPELKIQTTNGGGSPRLSFLHGVLGSASEWRPGFIQSVGDAVNYTGALEFYTNGTGSANRFGFVRAMTMINGNVGIGVGGTNVPLTKFHVADGGLLVTGTTGTTPVSGAGTRMMYVPAKGGALRVGLATGSEWDDANIGISSFATGRVVTASGPNSVATGNSTTASGSDAFAGGLGSTATGAGSVALGNYADASGFVAVATGVGTTASGWASTAMGGVSVASGSYSVAIGIGTVAQAYSSLVIGRNNLISGTTSTWNPSEPVFVIGNGSSAISPSNAFTVLKDGQTHIGGSNPAGYMLNVNGNSYFNGTGSWSSGTIWSDARLKTNIVSVSGAVDKVMSLHGVTFDYRKADFPERNFPEGKQLGFIAQEVEKIVPEVVVTNSDGYKAVAYQNLTALLTEAIKEQQGTITGLRNENAELKARLQAIESRLGITPSGTGDLK